MRHVDIQDQQIELGGFHLSDHGFPVFRLIDGDIPDTAIDLIASGRP